MRALCDILYIYFVLTTINKIELRQYVGELNTHVDAKRQN